MNVYRLITHLNFTDVSSYEQNIYKLPINHLIIFIHKEKTSDKFKLTITDSHKDSEVTVNYDCNIWQVGQLIEIILNNETI